MFVYILETLSEDPKHFYVGLTQDFTERLKQHNFGQVSHTSKFKPWKIKNYFWFEDEKKAIAFEKYLKSGSGRAFAKSHF